MFFHIDEAGNTGNNLFDSVQPTLSYGMISSPRNVDVLGRALHREILRELDVEQLHASRLGMQGLSRVARPLLDLQQEFRFGFDYYYIHKPSFAVVLLFDSVFDCGINHGVNWSWYWTALRYPAVAHLGMLLDEELAKEGHRLFLAPRGSDIGAIVTLLTELRERTRKSGFDARICQVFDDAFTYGIEHPDDMDFGASDLKLVSPNAVAFQFVSAAIARRCRLVARRRGGRRRVSIGTIKIDHQQQFNLAQETTHFYQRKMAEGRRTAPKDALMLPPVLQDVERNELELRGMPQHALQFARSAESIGLQLADVFLWLVNRVEEGTYVPPPLHPLVHSILERTLIDSISMEGMAKRFERFMGQLPEIDEMSEAQLADGRKLMALHQKRVDKALGRTS